MPQVLSYATPSAMMEHYTSPYDKSDADGNPAFDFVEAVWEAIFSEWRDNLPLARLQTHLKTATGGFLDKFGRFWGVGRLSGEDDDIYRIRIAQRIVQKWGALNMDELLTIAATLLRTDAGSILFSENTYTNGTYAPARIRFGISQDVFLAAGETDVADARLRLEEALEEAAPAGVIIQVQFLGGAIWDEPSDTWDRPESVWGDESGGFESSGTTTPFGSPGGIGSDPIGSAPVGS